MHSIQENTCAVLLSQWKLTREELEIPEDMVDMIFHSLQPTPGKLIEFVAWGLRLPT